MTREEETQRFVTELIEFMNKATQRIIAELQELRFENDGDFNGHEAWLPNTRADILFEKSGKPPLQDTGRLRSELTNADNWDLRATFDGSTLTLNVPDVEDFTDSQYNDLENSDGGTYQGTKTGKKIIYTWKPPRMFKALSAQDMNWITEQLEKAIRMKYAS
jgi:hypothetical protein